MNRHEIPTHLSVEDKAFAGLTMRQLMTLAIGLGLAYGASHQLPLPMPVQYAIAACVLAGVAIAALWRPGGRPMEDWAFVLLRYWAIPRAAVWRVRRLDPAQRARGQSYEIVLPDAEFTCPDTESQR